VCTNNIATPRSDIGTVVPKKECRLQSFPPLPPPAEMEDWQQQTEYSGEYDREGPNHQACVWFWEIVTDYNHEMKARLLQYVTGEVMDIIYYLLFF
jgi:hypothetical protein